MKIITLNIQHGGGKRLHGILGFLESQDADTIVLTEFRENANARVLRAELKDMAFCHFASASKAPKNNSVRIFSKHLFQLEQRSALTPEDHHRFISARFEGHDIQGVYFAQKEQKRSLFHFLQSLARQHDSHPRFVVGDFNTGLPFQDETGSTFSCVDEFGALARSGLVDPWRTRHPKASELSWYSNAGSGFCIDHVFANNKGNELVSRVYYDHTPRREHISDHSALVVEFADNKSL